MGPCLCGDLYCSSCGPAQGNSRCYVCGAWAIDGGCYDPAACAEAGQNMDEEMARDYEESERLAAEWDGREFDGKSPTAQS